MADAPVPSVMDQIVSLCKRRGFIYPASEIYGGIRGFWDYGPLGVLLKNNIRDWWWRNMVECPPIGPDGHPVEIVGLDSAIIQHPKTWIASGHVSSFNDPMVDCRNCKARFRADKVFFLQVFTVASSDALQKLTEGFDSLTKHPGIDRENTTIRSTFNTAVTVPAEGDSPAAVFQTAEDLLNRHAKKHNIQFLKSLSVNVETGAQTTAGFLGAATLKDGSIRFIRIVDAREVEPGSHRPCPNCGTDNSLTEPRQFNLMLDTYPGPIRDEENKAYLRPETAQGIFLEFKNITDTTRVKVPFGVAQVGKSFRNEVTPRNFIFRSREFEQMEMEFFCQPDTALEWYQFWREERMKWWYSLGIKKENLRFRDHDKDELAFYSKATVDIEYLYPFTAPDFGELEGVAHRGDYDLTQHSKHSGNKLDYFDQELQLKLKAEGASAEDVKSKSRYIPNVIEPASGLTRAVLVLLCEAYRNEKGRQGTEEFLSFKPRFAPIKLGIFPLVNKDGMPEVAEKLYLELRQHFTCEYDPKQSIGKRYARMDEIGTPFCVTIDGQTLQDQTVTIRERDTMKQERIGIDKVRQRVADELSAA